MSDTTKSLRQECLNRIAQLQGILDAAERVVKDDHGILNDLGELQGLPGALDCRLSQLALARRLAGGG